jgi:putative (di)nucleoside polyphosphate hydrolase
VIDVDGYRKNVGMILANEDGQVFWARRVGGIEAWQFPQGGINTDETPEQALFRELAEETGLQPEHVKILGCTKRWLRYRLPRNLIRWERKPVCIGQKQIWYMLRLLGDECKVQLDQTEKPEFDIWCWVDYWLPPKQVVTFKQDVYREALSELAPLLFRNQARLRQVVKKFR